MVKKYQSYLGTYKEEIIYTNDFSSLDEAIQIIDQLLFLYKAIITHIQLLLYECKKINQSYYKHLLV